MKPLILVLLLIMGMSAIPLAGQAMGQIQIKGLDHPGIKWEWPIKADQYNFTVVTTTNYDMKNVTFNKDAKMLTFFGNSSLTENIAEIEIPSNLIGGNYTVYQDGKQVSPIILKNGNLTTVVLKSNDSGNMETKVMGTTYLPEFSSIAPAIMLASFEIMFVSMRS